MQLSIMHLKAPLLRTLMQKVSVLPTLNYGTMRKER